MRTGEGWLYSATVIDLCTRMIVGWAMADHMRASHCVSALEMARDRAICKQTEFFIQIMPRNQLNRVTSSSPRHSGDQGYSPRLNILAHFRPIRSDSITKV
ncbi:DDE-type integrase/transposase/recombinase [Arthrobacter psychrochitiniphilus]|uniref:DDE-type integrase/transposase/recombinase n=1 Tax=Arthrobacter psychrochitiniphilus TaxID=291045 RepID=UPI003F7BC939